MIYEKRGLIKNIGDKKWANKFYKKEADSTEERHSINFISLKSEMDDSGDIIIESDLEEGRIMILRSGSGGDSEYGITVEIATMQEDTEEEYDDGEGEYNIISSFGSGLNEIKNAVQCFLDEGGSLNCFAEYKLEK